MTIKAVIFDMDGVLIDARDWHYEALNKALGVFGLEISRYDHLTTFDGLPTHKKLDMLSVERGLPRGLHHFINRLKQKYTMEEIFCKCTPEFPREYALSRLKQDGYRMAVCSNSIRQSVSVMLAQANLTGYIDFFLSNQDVKKPKPDPEIYVTAIEQLKLNPKEVLIVEDNENGCKAALASGAHLLKVIGVSDVNYSNICKRISEINGSNFQ